MKKIPILFLAPALLASGAAIVPGADSDRQQVEQAVADYVDAIYQVDPALVERSVHPSLAKVGFNRANANNPYRVLRMTYDELRQFAGVWNRSGRIDVENAAREIVVFEVLDQTATAKLTADWGVDYLHLAKFDGRWQIVNVLWQSVVAEEAP